MKNNQTEKREPTRRTDKLVNKTSDAIRSELNIERWSIWTPSHDRSISHPRQLERDIIIDGQTVKAKVTVRVTDLGPLNTTDQKVYYSLIKIWEEKGEKDDVTFFSMHQLMRVMNYKWGSYTLKTLNNSLDRLRMTFFSWEHSFYDAETKKFQKINNDPFTILDQLYTVKKSRDGISTTSQDGYFKFNPMTMRNLKANFRKPILFQVVLSFKSDTAQIVYGYLDLKIKPDGQKFERTVTGLLDDLGLSNKTTQAKSARSKKMLPVIAELQHKPLSKGGCLSIRLEETKDGTDWKIVCENVKLAAAGEIADAHATEAAVLIKKLKIYGVKPILAARFVAEDMENVRLQILNLQMRQHLKGAEAVKVPGRWLEKALKDKYELIVINQQENLPYTIGKPNEEQFLTEDNHAAEAGSYLAALIERLKIGESACKEPVRSKLAAHIKTLEELETIITKNKPEQPGELILKTVEEMEAEFYHEIEQLLTENELSIAKGQVKRLIGEDKWHKMTAQARELELQSRLRFALREKFNAPRISLFEI